MIGPNGGGKTTLLKVILGLLQPQRGTVTVFGRAPAEVRARIGYVPQYAQVDPSVPASVIDVVLAGRLGRSSWGFRYGRGHVELALAALAQTEMEEFAERRIGTLSGGQRQRVLIARALAADAELLLLDEPTAGVDPHMERGLTDLLHRLNQRLPIVIVSHDVAFVSRHLKRVACLNRRLSVHRASEISWDSIGHLYHDQMRGGAPCARVPAFRSRLHPRMRFRRARRRTPAVNQFFHDLPGKPVPPAQPAGQPAGQRWRAA